MLIFGSEKWVLSEAIERKVEVKNTDFIRQIMGNQAQQLLDEIWETPRAEEVQESTVTQLAMTYIRRWKATVV